MARTNVTITLELDQPDEAVARPAGIARLQDGTARSFQGWLGLAEAIASLARTHLRVSPPESSTAEETP